MNLHTNNPVLDKAVARLTKALRSCQDTTDRPRARKSARARSLSALRLVRATLDREFPVLTNGPVVRTFKTPKERIKKLEKAGWESCQATQVALYAAAGVPVKGVAWKETQVSYSPKTYVNGKGWVQGKTTNVIKHEVLLVPDWAVAIGPNEPTKLRAAKKSRKLRNVVRTVAALAEPHE